MHGKMLTYSSTEYRSETGEKVILFYSILRGLNNVKGEGEGIIRISRVIRQQK